MKAAGPILVPLDGSELAERAVPVAVEIARRAGAELRLVHVHVALPVEPIYVEGLPVVDAELHPQRRRHEQAYLDRAVQQLAGGVGASVMILEGSPAAALAGYARTSGARLVVMTTHGRGGLEHLWLGSVAEELTRLSPVPLLLIRPGASSVPGAFRRVLVPLDGSPLSESILPHASWIARLDPAGEVVLLQVVQPATDAIWVADASVLAAGGTADLVRREEENARRRLDALVERLAAEGVPARGRVVVSANVAKGILDAARKEAAEVVALATHGRSGLVRLALGSIADKVLRGSPVPVLLYRPPEKA